MSNGKVIIILLIVGLIKNISYKKQVNIFLNHQVMKKILQLKLIFLIMQQKNKISKIFLM